MRFGVHISVTGSLSFVAERAIERGCEAIQIFSSNPRSWKEPSFDLIKALQLKEKLAQAGIYPLILHAPYLISLGSRNFNLRLKSALYLIEGVKKAEILNAPYFIFHLGSHKNISKKEGLKRVIESLEYVLSESKNSTTLLLENMPKMGAVLGSDFNDLKLILRELNWDNRLGICFDTCHAFLASYDLSTKKGFLRTIKEIEKTVTLERIMVIHANDSKLPFGSSRDLHADIGKGYIGLEGFRCLVNFPQFSNLPCILETPKMTLSDDLRNLETIRQLKKGGR